MAKKWNNQICRYIGTPISIHARMWANPMTQQLCRCRRRSFDVMTCAKSELPEPYVHVRSVNTHSPPVLSGVFSWPSWVSLEVGKSSRDLACHGQPNWPTVTGCGSRSLSAYRCTAPYMGKTPIAAMQTAQLKFPDDSKIIILPEVS